jgi:hypothetical protein
MTNHGNRNLTSQFHFDATTVFRHNAEALVQIA